MELNLITSDVELCHEDGDARIYYRQAPPPEADRLMAQCFVNIRGTKKRTLDQAAFDAALVERYVTRLKNVTVGSEPLTREMEIMAQGRTYRGFQILLLDKRYNTLLPALIKGDSDVVAMITGEDAPEEEPPFPSPSPSTSESPNPLS